MTARVQVFMKGQPPSAIGRKACSAGVVASSFR